MPHLVTGPNPVDDHPLTQCAFDFDDFGPNFSHTGAVEIPKHVANPRLSFSTPSTLHVQTWTQRPEQWCHVWTDGSCDFQNFFFHTLGAFSAIGLHGIVLQTGVVSHPLPSPYTTELWAVTAAFPDSKEPIHIHAACWTVKQQTQYMIQRKLIPTPWSHYTWWCFFLQIFLQRLPLSPEPIRISWCPAHVLESAHTELISEHMAREHNTTTRDIFHNRIAEATAKKTLVSQYADFHHRWN